MRLEAAAGAGSGPGRGAAGLRARRGEVREAWLSRVALLLGKTRHLSQCEYK